jgi:hypothetical protein
MDSPRRRVRELGIAPGILPVGKWNSITDVSGVKVGHVTLIEGEDIRTGVTAILPHEGNLFQDKLPAGIVVGNGFGKLTGSTQVQELGEIETPILLTNTLSVHRAAEAMIEWVLAQAGNEDVRSVNPVVGETNDGLLNNIRKMAVTKEHILQAIDAAASRAGRRGMCRRGHRDGLLWLEGRDRYKLKNPAGEAWRIHDRRFSSGQFRRCPANGWHPGGQKTRSILLEGSFSRSLCRRFDHDRPCDKCTAFGSKPTAAREPWVVGFGTDRRFDEQRFG